MCYNEFNGLSAGDCRVNIRSSGDGWSEDIGTEGKISFSDGALCLNYTLKGDGCSLTFKNGAATQIRRGLQCLSLSFIEGQKTNCVIGEGGLCGSFGITTSKLKIVSGKGGFRLSLEYISGTDGEKVNLVLTAVKI